MPTRPKIHQPYQNKIPKPKRAKTRERGYSGSWIKLRRYILNRDHYICAACNCAAGMSANVDHIVPKSAGGSDDANNLQVLCQSCHSVKTRKEKNKRV